MDEAVLKIGESYETENDWIYPYFPRCGRTCGDTEASITACILKPSRAATLPAKMQRFIEFLQEQLNEASLAKGSRQPDISRSE